MRPATAVTTWHRAAVRIVVAEDLFLLRDGLTRLLEASGFEVVAAVEDASGFLSAVAEHRPDLALVDVRLPPSLLTRDFGARCLTPVRLLF
jgi:DNA-binding NarL/FixJ family response regulator